MKVKGIHHISATVGHAQKDVDFYYGLLGMRLVKQTLNYDDPNTYHLYYGNKNASNGIMTTFPMTDAIEGIIGAGQLSRSIFAIPKGAMDFYIKRLEDFNLNYKVEDVFGETRFHFDDIHGLKLGLVEKDEDISNNYETNFMPKDKAFIGIDNAELLSHKPEETLKLFKEVFGYDVVDENDQSYKLAVSGKMGGTLELNKQSLPLGRQGQGTVHHLALNVDDIEAYHKILTNKGFKVTEIKNRFYFKSLYFKEPGGIIIELASGGKGMLADEPVEELGTNFIIPRHFQDQEEAIRNKMMPLEIREITGFASYGYRDKYEYDLIKEKNAIKKKISNLLSISKSRTLSENELNLYEDLKVEYLKLGRKSL